MKRLPILFILILTAGFSIAQNQEIEVPQNISFPDTSDIWQSDSIAYGDSTNISWEDESFEEEPQTMKGILRSGVQDLESQGKQTVNQLTQQAAQEAGQFLDQQARKFFDGIKQKLAGKKGENQKNQNSTEVQPDSTQNAGNQHP